MLAANQFAVQGNRKKSVFSVKSIRNMKIHIFSPLFETMIFVHSARSHKTSLGGLINVCYDEHMLGQQQQKKKISFHHLTYTLFHAQCELWTRTIDSQCRYISTLPELMKFSVCTISPPPPPPSGRLSELAIFIKNEWRSLGSILNLTNSHSCVSLQTNKQTRKNWKLVSLHRSLSSWLLLSVNGDSNIPMWGLAAVPVLNETFPLFSSMLCVCLFRWTRPGRTVHFIRNERTNKLL